mmetsp:Transcript_28540/g.51659  ORF Transcript_28540/g.51659 Transcript_28540/m.51659 type:complete len:546 (-) Transcript_28540:91-1728(-)
MADKDVPREESNLTASSSTRDGSSKPLKSALKPKSRLQVRRPATVELYALVLSSFIWESGQFLLIPVLPYFAMARDASALQFAMTTTAYALAQMVSAPLMGLASDRIGRRPVLLLALAFTCFGYTFMSQIQTVPQLLLARAAIGFFSGADAAETAYLADITTQDERPGWLKLKTSLGTAGCMLGPAVGGILTPYSEEQSAYGLPRLCLAMAFLCAVNFLIGAFCFTPESDIKVKRHALTESSSLLTVLMRHFSHRTTAMFLVAGFLDCFAMAVSDGPEAYYLNHQFDFEPQQQAWFMMTFSASSLISGHLALELSKVLSARMICIVFSFASAAAVSTFSFTRDYWAPYAYAIIFGCTATVVDVIGKTSLMSNLIPEGRQGTVYGIEKALINLGFSIGPLIGGCIYVEKGLLPYRFSAVIFCLSAAFYASLPSKGRSSSFLLSGSGAWDEEDSEVLEYMAHKATIPGKRVGASIATEKARRVFFVCPELYQQKMEENQHESVDGPQLQKTHTIGELSFAGAVEAKQTRLDDMVNVKRSSTSHGSIG